MTKFEFSRPLVSLEFLIFLCVGIGGYLLPEIGFFRSIPGDLGDARFISVILEHLYRWVLGSDVGLWDPPFFYPFEHVLGFSENFLGSGLIYVLFRLSGFLRETAYDAWFCIGALLNFLAAYWTLRRLKLSALAAASGAFVFSFSLPTLLTQSIHSQLLYRFAIPFAVLGFYRALDGQRFYYLWQTFFWVAVQFYCSIYMGVFLSYLLAAATLGVLFLRDGRQKVVRAIASFQKEPLKNQGVFVLMTFFSAMAVIWLLNRYQATAHEYGFTKSIGEISNMLPTLKSYLVSDLSRLSSWVGQWSGDLPVRWEHQLFVGIGVAMIASYGAIVVLTAERNEIFGRVALASWCLLFVATLYLNGVSIYLWLIKTIPAISAIRVVSRIILIMLFPIAILVAVGIDRIGKFRIFQGRLMKIVLVLGTALLIGSETASYKPYNQPISVWRGRIDSMKKMLPERLPDQAILYVSQSSSEPHYLAELDGMILSQDIGVRTTNGFSGNAPPGFLPPDPCISYLNRLFAYADFYRKPRESVADMVSRVVHLAPEPCEGEPIVSSDRAITADQAKRIRIEIIAVDYPGRRITVKVVNNSSMVFSSLSNKGPVRLSWRFVPVTAEDVPLGNPGWDTRHDWLFAIKPGEIASETFEVSFPQPFARYRIEVSLVQDGVSWLHDLGMPIASRVENNL